MASRRSAPAPRTKLSRSTRSTAGAEAHRFGPRLVSRARARTVARHPAQDAGPHSFCAPRRHRRFGRGPTRRPSHRRAAWRRLEAPHRICLPRLPARPRRATNAPAPVRHRLARPGAQREFGARPPATDHAVAGCAGTAGRRTRNLAEAADGPVRSGRSRGARSRSFTPRHPFGCANGSAPRCAQDDKRGRVASDRRLQTGSGTARVTAGSAGVAACGIPCNMVVPIGPRRGGGAS